MRPQPSWGKPDLDGVLSDLEKKHIADIQHSVMWRRFVAMLEGERASRYLDPADSRRAIWRREGALDILNWLLHNAPMAVVLSLRDPKAMDGETSERGNEVASARPLARYEA